MTKYEKVKEWRKNNPEKVAEQARRYRAKHPETGAKASKKYYEKDLDSSRQKLRNRQRQYREEKPHLQKARMEKFKLKKESELWEIAGRPRPNTCELCFENSFTVFDHCHNNGHFRGWICDRCNRVLGSVKDDIKILQAMIDYLEKDRGKINHKEKECSA
jgi:Recombination endonuclease VII